MFDQFALAQVFAGHATNVEEHGPKHFREVKFPISVLQVQNPNQLEDDHAGMSNQGFLFPVKAKRGWQRHDKPWEVHRFNEFGGVRVEALPSI